MDVTEKSFAALLSQAPVYQQPDSVTLIGALARTSEEGQFALVQSDGSAVILDSNAVESHSIVGSSFGQYIVEVHLDTTKVSQEKLQHVAASVMPAYSTGPGDIRTGAADRSRLVATSIMPEYSIGDADNRTGYSADRPVAMTSGPTPEYSIGDADNRTGGADRPVMMSVPVIAASTQEDGEMRRPFTLVTGS